MVENQVVTFHMNLNIIYDTCYYLKYVKIMNVIDFIIKSIYTRDEIIMNIKTMKKIRKGREAFPKFKLKKRGRNNFQKFNYFKLEDLIPVDNALCKKLNLFTRLNQENEENISLEVYDLDQDDDQEVVSFHIPSCVINNGNITQGSQEHGNVQTYSWRYLLYQLWNVSESDEIDASDIGLNTPVEDLPQQEISPKRISEITHSMGEYIQKNGGDNCNKNDLYNELNRRLRAKLVTNDEFAEVKKVIDNLG